MSLDTPNGIFGQVRSLSTDNVRLFNVEGKNGSIQFQLMISSIPSSYSHRILRFSRGKTAFKKC
jgi:hypothetical protein